MSNRQQKFWQGLWTVLQAEVQPLEAVDGVAMVSGAALGLAAALGAVPAIAIAAATCSPVLLMTKAVRLYKEKNKGATLAEFVAAIAPVAYFSSFTALAQRLPKLASLQQPNDSEPSPILEPIALDRDLAINVLRCFHRSELAQLLNQVLSKELKRGRLSETECAISTGWVAWGTQTYLQQAIQEAGDAVDVESINLANIYNAAQESEPSAYRDIERYLSEKIAPLPQEKVFSESFSFAEIYVRLKAVPVDANGKIVDWKTPFVLENWAKEMLENPRKQQQVMFVQGGPGRGKSVFCRMFADWVRQHLHPFWTPVFIRLRDIDTFEQSFERTLQGAVSAPFAKTEGWLNSRQQRFFFLLDGFDELRLEGRASGGIERFIKQVGAFQERCQGHRFIVTGRQLALQGISYLPPNLERVELVAMEDKIQQQWLEKWQQVVAENPEQAAAKRQDFEAFLRDDACPETVQTELAREPLLLYLLVAMHRDGDLKVEDLAGSSGIEAKIKIYEKSLDWVLTRQRQKIQTELVRLEPQELERVLVEAGLCVVQSGGEYAKVSAIEARLKESARDIADKIKEIREQKGDKVLKNALAAFYLKPASGDAGGSVEFFHKSFGEFLFAKRLQEGLEDCTERDRRGRGFRLSDSQLAETLYDLLGYGGLTQEIVEYLMGLLSRSEDFPWVVLFERLERFYLDWCEGEFIDAPPDTNYPQQKMRRLREQATVASGEATRLGLRQVDVYAGLNVTILLLELHRYGQAREELREWVVFYPCGRLNEEGKAEDPMRLYRAISYSCCLGPAGFKLVRSFLSRAFLGNAFLRGTNFIEASFSRANLNRADLSGANFRGANLIDTQLINTQLINTNFKEANLSNANLSNADLRGADLRGTILRRTILRHAILINATLINAVLSGAKLSVANLRDVNLTNADLVKTSFSGADLRGANLSNANLRDANLRDANLRDTNLRGANLSGANLSGADLESVRWNKRTGWNNVKRLEKAKNVPDKLRQQLGL